MISKAAVKKLLKFASKFCIFKLNKIMQLESKFLILSETKNQIFEKLK